MISSNILLMSIAGFVLTFWPALGAPIFGDLPATNYVTSGDFTLVNDFGGPMDPGVSGYVGPNDALPPLKVPVNPLAIFPQTDVIPSTSVYPVVSVFPTLYNDYSIYGPPYVPYSPSISGASFGGFDDIGLGGMAPF